MPTTIYELGYRAGYRAGQRKVVRLLLERRLGEQAAGFVQRLQLATEDELIAAALLVVRTRDDAALVVELDAALPGAVVEGTPG